MRLAAEIAIVGAGFSGARLAVELLRRGPGPAASPPAGPPASAARRRALLLEQFVDRRSVAPRRARRDPTIGARAAPGQRADDDRRPALAARARAFRSGARSLATRTPAARSPVSRRRDRAGRVPSAAAAAGSRPRDPERARSAARRRLPPAAHRCGLARILRRRALPLPAARSHP